MGEAPLVLSLLLVPVVLSYPPAHVLVELVVEVELARLNENENDPPP